LKAHVRMRRRSKTQPPRGRERKKRGVDIVNTSHFPGIRPWQKAAARSLGNCSLSGHRIGEKKGRRRGGIDASSLPVRRWFAWGKKKGKGGRNKTALLYRYSRSSALWVSPSIRSLLQFLPTESAGLKGGGEKKRTSPTFTTCFRYFPFEGP